jgi:O-Antigen ligase
MSVAFDSLHVSADWYAATRKRQLVLLTTLVGIMSLALVRLILMFPVGAAGGVVAWLALVVVVLQPRYGVYLLLALILPFEAGDPRDNPFQMIGFFVNASPQTSLQVGGAILTPLEILLLLVCAAWLCGAAIRRKLDFRAGILGKQALLFGVALIFGIVRGLMAGADFNVVMWESRFLVAMVLCYVVAANTIRTQAHVQALLRIVFICVGLSGLEGVWRKFALADAGLLGDVKEFWFSHEGVVIWGLLIFLVMARLAFGGSRWQQLLGLPLTCTAVFAMLLSERRAGYIAAILAFVALALVLFVAQRKAFWLIAFPVLVAGAIYMPLFWNNTGTLGQPARAVRSISEPDPRDAASNAWRDLEAINVRATIQSDPLLGIGFGRPFLQVVQVPSIAYFGFWNLEAHHNILWVWMKTGILGFICFFAFVLGGVSRGAWMIRTFKQSDYRVLAALTMCAVIMSLVFCYVDLGLTSSRIPMMLGILLGAAAVLPQIHEQELLRAQS